MKKFLMSLSILVFLTPMLYAQSPSEAKPSFDCAKASTKVEKMICSDIEGNLQNLDRYMAEVYAQLRKELKISKFPDKEQRLKDLLDSQRAFINNNVSYENRITDLLKLLGKVLDSNNKELCEYARQHDEFDESKWQELPPSANPPFSIGYCAFGSNNQYGSYYGYCTESGKATEEMAKAIKEGSLYLTPPHIYKRKIDINNDGVLDDVILSIGEYYDALAIYKNGKLDTKASDKIYGDDLHFHGEKTEEVVCLKNEVPCLAFQTYAMPSNKISQRLEFNFEAPILSHLSYGVMEFKGKNYITLYSYRFSKDENSTYPTTRIYLLKGDKLELKCTYKKKKY
ncbi:lysozyme inhibitor LprI family protein [Campylobacter taeniopygiae]|uniref:Lysozyme inhibitor LprI N-terminal domain-containing protein n=1 Tax=Campylobacter taeniopygiae TaxID=2510188 RepID=A0ABY2TH66_9BACT|nr:DUF1311 domain-containing protein [Campylobacter taeniopygiae]TKX32859.1 hypothetical protein CQA75_08880 [Campylobacter taeniopygiae]